MQVYEKIADIKKTIAQWKKEGAKIGFAPTMGYLHEGHGSLVKKSVSENDKTIVSIFVNPLQFSENEDFESYPRDFEKDKKMLEDLKVDAIFYPSYDEIYGKNNLTTVLVASMSEKLCGISRPIHFKGVTTVITKFFNIISPDNAYFGLKDFQQYSIIRKMCADLNFNINIIGVPIVRGEGGIALSSRNVYLNKDEITSALSLNQSLNLASELIGNKEKNSKIIIEAISQKILSHPYVKVDYIKIVDRDSLEDIDYIQIGCSAILLAIYVGKTRLIDNILI